MRDYEDLVSAQLEAGIQVRIYVGVGAGLPATFCCCAALLPLTHCPLDGRPLSPNRMWLPVLQSRFVCVAPAHACCQL